MNLLDIVVVILLILGVIVGAKRGLIKEVLQLGGFIVIVMAAFLFKNPLSVYLYNNLPFINFPGILSGVSVINILMYEVFAFFGVFVIFYFVFRILVIVSKLFDKIVNSVVVLGVPNTIGGAILGFIENYFVVFIVLYIVSLPIFNINIVKNSRLRNIILENTPVLNIYVRDAVNVGNEFWDIVDKYQNGEGTPEQLNLETLDLLLKYNITSVEAIDSLVENNKIQINNIEIVLMKYRKA